MPADRVLSASPRERILAAADDLFYQHGFRAVGVDTIIARSQVAKATLYSHFAAKDDLIVTVLEERDRRWLAELDRALAGGDQDAVRRLLALFDVLGEEMERDGYRGSAFLNAVTEFPDPDHPVRRACRAHQDRLRLTFASLVREAGLRDPDVVALKLMMLIDGATCLRLVGTDPAAARHAREAAELIVADAQP